jgi:hypothetical protein
MKELNHLQACIASAAEVCGSEWMIAWLRIRFPRSEIGTDIESLHIPEFFDGMSIAATRKAALRCCDDIERDMLTSSATSRTIAPRLRNALEVNRRLLAADILGRTGASQTAMRHLRYVQRNATYPSQVLLRIHATTIAMVNSSICGNIKETQRLASVIADLRRVAVTLDHVQAITCTLRSIAARRSVRFPRGTFETSIHAASEIVAQRASSYPDVVVIEVAFLASLYCQFTGNFQHGLRWMRAQERAYQRLGIWNASTMRENFILRMTVEVQLHDYRAAIATANRLLKLEPPGSSSWYNLVNQLTGLLIRSKGYDEAIKLLKKGFEHQNFRRLDPALRRRLLYASGYLAVFTNSASLWSTYERRRRMERDTSLKTMHHRVIDVLRMLQRRDPDVIEATEYLASQLSRFAPNARPVGVQQLITIVRSAYATRATRKVRASMSDSTAYLDEVVPWSVVVEFATSCTAPNVPTPQATRSRRASTRRQASATS